MTSSLRGLQFIGTQRSGSNLLRVMLNQLPEISAPHPPHILQTIMPLLPMYGDLNRHENFAQLIDDVCLLVEKNPVNWHIHFNRAEVLQRCENSSLPQVMKAVYELKALQKNAQFWSCKSMASIHYTGEMEDAGLHPFYLHIFRDGRDVALSFKKAIVGEKHIYHLAQQWKEEQELSLELFSKIGPARCISVRYEDLIADPEKEMRTICDKLGIVYRPEVMLYNESDESKETASSGEMWSNLVKPVMKDNRQKFLTELSETDIILFETVAGSTLEKLGYTLHSKSSERQAITAEQIQIFSEENSRLKKIARAQASPSDIEKRAAQDEFISSLRKKFEVLKVD